MSEVIGRCGGDEKTEWPRRNDKWTLKKNQKIDIFATYSWRRLHVTQAYYGFGKSQAGDTENAIFSFVYGFLVRPVFWPYIAILKLIELI